MSIKLIASDLDGTLLTEKKEVTDYTKEILSEAGKRGIHFVPATGRAFRSIPQEVLSLPHVEYVITSNGAAIYSVSRKKRIYQSILTKESVEAILSLELSEGTAMEVFVDGVPYSQEAYIRDPKAYGATDYGVIYVQSTRHPVKDIRTFIREHSGEVDSLSFVSADEQTRRILRRRLETEVPGIYVTTSISHMLEIGNENAGKGKTLRHLLELLSIRPEEAMAFGDADNDVDMLTAVKYGIAMSNGTESCKRAAYAVTAENEKDGVAAAICKYL